MIHNLDKLEQILSDFVVSWLFQQTVNSLAGERFLLTHLKHGDVKVAELNVVSIRRGHWGMPVRRKFGWKMACESQGLSVRRRLYEDGLVWSPNFGLQISSFNRQY